MEGRFNYMSPDQLQIVIDTIPDLGIRRWLDYDVEYLFKNLYWMALRPAEGIRLKKEDFNLLEKQCYLGKTTTIKQDFVPISISLLRLFLKICPTVFSPLSDAGRIQASILHITPSLLSHR